MGPKNLHFSKFPGDADAAGRGPHLDLQEKAQVPL